MVSIQIRHNPNFQYRTGKVGEEVGQLFLQDRERASEAGMMSLAYFLRPCRVCVQVAAWGDKLDRREGSNHFVHFRVERKMIHPIRLKGRGNKKRSEEGKESGYLFPTLHILQKRSSSRKLNGASF